MANRLNISWPRIFAEGTAIVVSILLAFWIQAWWDERQSRDDEVIVLQSLLGDLAQKRTLLANQRQRQEASFRSVSKLLAAATESRQSLNSSEIDRLLGDILWYTGHAQWDSGPLNALMMGGNSRLITNVILLNEIASLQVGINLMRDDYRNEQDFYRQRLMPFLGQNASLPQINMAIEHIPGRPDQPYIFPELVISEPRDHSALLSNLEFQGLLTESIELFPHILRPGYPTIDAQLDKVISMLEEELAR